MVVVNPTSSLKLELKTLGWTDKGERIEPHDLNFVKVIQAGVPEDEPANPFNYRTRPIEDMLDIPGVAAWNKELDKYRS